MMIMLMGCATNPSKQAVHDMSAKELLEAARDATENAEFKEALKLYDQIEARFPYSIFSKQALLDQAYNYYQQTEDELALATIARFLRLYPKQAGTDYAYYLRGMIHFGMGERGFIDFLIEAAQSKRDIDSSKKSYDAFETIVTQYPKSKYTQEAKARMRVLFNQMALYEVNLARFYYERKAYTAAIERSKAALENFQIAQAQEEALALLAASYHHLDLIPLRNDTLAILRENYPNTQFESLIDF